MQYNILGKTGIRVSALALGTATFGVAPDANTAEHIVTHAIDAGINLFDTANSYGNQVRFDRPGAPSAAERLSAEEILGAALAGRRRQVILCTKVSELVGDGLNDQGLSRRHILEQVERSLKRLRTDHIDILYAHHPDGFTDVEDTLRTFDDLIRQGKIRYYALSTYNAWQMTEVCWVAERLNISSPACNQIPFSLAYRNPERDLLSAATRLGVPLTIFSPLAGGLLAGKAGVNRTFTGAKRWGGGGFTEAQLAISSQLDTLSARVGIPAPQLALAWLLAQPQVASAILGPEAIHELDANLAAADLVLEPVLLNELNEIGRVTWGPGGF